MGQAPDHQCHEHLVAARLLRRGRADLVRPPQQMQVEARDLAIYDTILGVTDLDGGMA